MAIRFSLLRPFGAFALACTLGATAHAGTLTFDFATLSNGAAGTCTGNCNLGVPSTTFTQDGVSVTADAGMTGQGEIFPTVSQRFGSPTGAETGLGVFSGGDSTGNGSSLEIATNEYLTLDLTNVLNAGYRLASITIGSIQKYEGGSIYGLPYLDGPPGLPASSPIATLKNLPASQTYDFNSGNDLTPYLLVNGVDEGSAGANVLVQSVTFDKVPEPGSLALLGTGLLGLLLASRRRRPALAA